MAELQQEKKNNFEVNNAFDRIMEQNPQIIPARVELFTEVYYPIAILEMEISETTFEDFDIVPLTVLRFINLGLRSADEISDMLGLSVSYVQKILDLLMGYSYINSEGITDLGRESLQKQQKITHAIVKQRFQTDAITGELLRIGEQSPEADLQGRKSNNIMIPHIQHIDGIAIDNINDQLLDRDITGYLQYKGDILNSNADEIKEVKCVELQYIKAYLIKMQGIDSPFIFTYRYDSNQTTLKKRFRWLPMKMPCEKAYDEYGFSREIDCYSNRALETINELYRLVCRRIIEIDEEKLKSLLKHIHPFDYSTMDISMGRVVDGIPEQIYIYVNSDSFTKWNPFVLRFLEGFDDVIGYLYTDSWLNGLFIRFESQNQTIRRASKAYKKMIRHENKNKLKSFLKEELFTEETDGKAIDFNHFFETLDQYNIDKEED